MLRSGKVRSWHGREPLLFGIAAATILGLVAASGLVSWLELNRARVEVSKMAQDAARTAALASSIGRGVSRMRAQALETLTEDVEPAQRAELVADARRQFDVVQAQLAADLEGLGRILAAKDASLWVALEPQIGSLSDLTGRAFDELARNELRAAETTLDECRVLSRGLQGRLDEVLARSRDETGALLKMADERLQKLARFTLLSGSMVLLGAAAIFALLGQRVAIGRREAARYLEQVEQVNRDLDAFAGRVAHDLRNVLSPITTAARFLDHCSKSADVKEMAEVIERSAWRGEALLDRLLAFARRGGPEPDGLARVESVAVEVVEDLRAQREEVGATIELDIADLYVAMSPSLLYVVLSNLLGNALKFMNGEEERRVRVHAERAGNACAIEVLDSGPGIPPAELERVFEPFHRVPGVAASGAGIGLATVKRVVEAHGGSVRASEASGGGACFRVLLPLAAQPAPQPPLPSEPRREGAGSPRPERS